MSNRNEELKRRQDARASKCVAEIVEDIAGRPFIGDEWADAEPEEQEDMRRTWTALVLKAILAACVLLCLGCSKPAPSAQCDLARCRVEAAHLIAYAARAKHPDAAPKEPDGEASPADIAEAMEAFGGSASNPGFMKRWAADVAKIIREDSLKEAQLSWEDIRGMVGTSKKIEAWINAFPSNPKRQVAPPDGRVLAEVAVNPRPRLLFFTAHWCEPCGKIKDDIVRSLIPKGWKVSPLTVPNHADDILFIDLEDIRHMALIAKHAKKNAGGKYEVPQFAIVDELDSRLDWGELDQGTVLRIKTQTVKPPGNAKQWRPGVEGIGDWVNEVRKAHPAK